LLYGLKQHSGGDVRGGRATESPGMYKRIKNWLQSNF
jgi:hypothetical protein